MKTIRTLLLFTIFLFTSCSKSTWASFTTPKENVENIPKILHTLLNNPSVKNIRVFEYNNDKYMVMFAYKAMPVNKKGRIEKTLNFNLVTPSKSIAIINGAFKTYQVNGYQLIEYTPEPVEDEIVTAHNLMAAINDLSKNTSFEIYSKTDASQTRRFMILLK